MVNLKAIKSLRPLLIDRVTYYPLKGVNEWHAKIWGTGEVLEPVKVDLSTSKQVGQKETTEETRGFVFVYNAFVTPKAYKIGDKIEYKGREYLVVGVDLTVIGYELEVVENGKD